MGLYRDHVVPRLVDFACGSAGFDRWRAQAADGLAGRVVEIGFGSGLNVPHYPPAVDVVLTVEPARMARQLAEKRIAASAVRVEHVGLDGREIPLEDAQRRLADGCHLTRDPTTLVEHAGFVMGQNEQRYVRGPKPWSWLTLGVAAKPRR